MTDPAVPVVKRKLIEVALPLEAINRESAREKSIRHGHPSTLHLWWARRPLATCRAVLFAQLVDDPSSHPERFPTEEMQATERRRLFELIERLVLWDNVADNALFREAHSEIAAAFDGESLPVILDPFAGGGSIPVEAQRLGLVAQASDLNPVAVLINKALIEFPPRWAGHPPVFPGAAEARIGGWRGAAGLAEDARRYGQWMHEQAELRLRDVYPRAKLAGGSTAPSVAWIWARTVACANPACGTTMPLVRSFWLSKNRDRPTWLRPVVEDHVIRFEVVADKKGPSAEGTVNRAGATCLACDSPVTLRYIREEAQAGRMGTQLMATVAEGLRQRVYLPASADQISAAAVARPTDVPEGELQGKARVNVALYGFNACADLFTNRQLVALTVFSDLITEVRQRIVADAATSHSQKEATEYANAVVTYLAFAISKMADRGSSICTWFVDRDSTRNTFARQAIPMTWDFAEMNPTLKGTGSFLGAVEWTVESLEGAPTIGVGLASQADAATRAYAGSVVSTDPPYYDNIGYADLSDFFYVWLRRSLREVYPDLLGTILTPKTQELVATPYRFGGSRAKANEHFEDGFVRTFTQIREGHPPEIPITIYYAFKQAEGDEEGVASTGWETMLSGLIEAGLSVTATWPMRSELSNRMLASGTNALASSIVLACRPLRATAEATTRRGFIQALHAELPKALRELQQGSIAPVDLAQAAIGPGMGVFTRYRTVVEADGSAMTVRTALALINHALDEVLSEQEGDFDPDTRFCVKWFTNYGWSESESGTADTLSRATNSSIAGLERGGIFRARAGRARLLGPDDLSDDWDPIQDERVTVWEVVVRVAKALDEQGGEAASALLALAGQRVDLDTVKELAYLLYSICEKRGMTASSRLFNGLGTSWSDLSAAARGAAARTPQPVQDALDFDSEEE